MDIIYNGMLLEVKNLQENQNCRLWMYYRKFQSLMLEKKEQERIYEKKQFIALFWDKESKWEQKIYGILKKWERKHPIMGIVFCTILGGILISLIASIIFQGIMLGI